MIYLLFLNKEVVDSRDIINIEFDDFINNDDFGTEGPSTENSILRDKVCIIEIWVECFGKNRSDIKKSDSNLIASIMSNIKNWEKSNKSYRFKIYGVQKAYIRKR